MAFLEKEGQIYKFAVAGMLLEVAERMTENLFPSTSFLDDQLVVVGEREEDGPIAKLKRPFLGKSWILVGGMLLVFGLFGVLVVWVFSPDSLSFVNMALHFLGDVPDTHDDEPVMTSSMGPGDSSSSLRRARVCDSHSSFSRYGMSDSSTSFAKYAEGANDLAPAMVMTNGFPARGICTPPHLSADSTSSVGEMPHPVLADERGLQPTLSRRPRFSQRPALPNISFPLHMPDSGPAPPNMSADSISSSADIQQGEQPTLSRQQRLSPHGSQPSLVRSRYVPGSIPSPPNMSADSNSSSGEIQQLSRPRYVSGSGPSPPNVSADSISSSGDIRQPPLAAQRPLSAASLPQYLPKHKSQPSLSETDSLSQGSQPTLSMQQQGLHKSQPNVTMQHSLGQPIRHPSQHQSLQQMQDEDGRIEREQSAIRNREALYKSSVLLWRIALSMFLVILLLFYEVAVVNFLFLEQSSSEQVRIAKLNWQALNKFAVLKNSAIESVWSTTGTWVLTLF